MNPMMKRLFHTVRDGLFIIGRDGVVRFGNEAAQCLIPCVIDAPMPNPALRPGGFASVRVTAGALQAVVLPQSAVQSDGQGNFVYTINAKNEAVRTPIKTGDVSESGILITSGLKGDERVVLTAGAFLSPGQKVIPNLQKTR